MTPALLVRLTQESVADKELSTLLQGNRLVPIVHNATYDDLRNVSAMLASRSGLSTAEDSLAVIAEKIADLVAIHRGSPRARAAGHRVHRQRDRSMRMLVTGGSVSRVAWQLPHRHLPGEINHAPPMSITASRAAIEALEAERRDLSILAASDSCERRYRIARKASLRTWPRFPFLAGMFGNCRQGTWPSRTPWISRIVGAISTVRADAPGGSDAVGDDRHCIAHRWARKNATVLAIARVAASVS